MQSKTEPAFKCSRCGNTSEPQWTSSDPVNGICRIYRCPVCHKVEYQRLETERPTLH